jgi:DeoR family transcriptional regulator of aga operon
MYYVDHTASSGLTAERRAAIARIVAQSGAIRVADLAARFDVNPATIRRDMKVLAEQGALRRVHGGAVAVEQAKPTSSDVSSGAPQARIGRAAAELVADGETVFLGTGQLQVEVACFLVARSRLTVVTNDLKVAHWVAANTTHALIVTGGQLEGRGHTPGMALVGSPARAVLSTLRADHVVLELGGVSAVEGLSCDSLPQAEIAQVLLDTGAQVIVLVSAERVGRVAAAWIAPISAADVVVTAREAPSSVLWDLSESGVRIVLA